MNRILNSQSAAFAAYAGKLVAAFMLLTGALAVSSVEAANPSFTTTIPRGAQVGTEQKVTFYGSRLSDAEEIMFHHPGISVKEFKVLDD